MENEDPRFWILDAENETNKIGAVSDAADQNMVAIVDEIEGGIIGYAPDGAHADRILAALRFREHYLDVRSRFMELDAGVISEET